MIVVAVEGGLVRSVSSDDLAEQGKEVIIIDYDAEGADPEEIEKVPQGKKETADAVISAHEVGRLYGPVAKFLKARTPSGRTGWASTYARGDVVETPLGTGTIDTVPDERGRCMVVPERPLDDGTTRFSATTFQFGRIVRKRDSTRKTKEKKP